jgi:hypothetical protein
MNIFVTILVLAATIVVMMRCINLVAHLNRKMWFGHSYMFGGFSISIALAAGGSVGVCFGWDQAPAMLLIGFAGWMIFDRRSNP